jgi:hypothetical protein
MPKRWRQNSHSRIFTNPGLPCGRQVKNEGWNVLRGFRDTVLRHGAELLELFGNLSARIRPDEKRRAMSQFCYFRVKRSNAVCTARARIRRVLKHLHIRHVQREERSDASQATGIFVCAARVISSPIDWSEPPFKKYECETMRLEVDGKH